LNFKRLSVLPGWLSKNFYRFWIVALILESSQTQARDASILLDYDKTFNKVVIEVGVASTNFSYSLALGDCETKDQSKFKDALKKIDILESEANIAASALLGDVDPVSIEKRQIVQSLHSKFPQLVSHLKIIQAKAALDSKKCDEIADQLYRDVVELDASPGDVRKAMLGIEDLRERRRSGTSKSFGDRWWNGK
jgi:hypothetical protein